MLKYHLLFCLALSSTTLAGQNIAELRQIFDLDSENPRFMPVKPGVNITAAEFLSNYKTALGLGPNDKLIEYRVTDEPEMNMKHYRYKQHHNGIPVMDGELLLHEKSGVLCLVSGEVVLNLQAAIPYTLILKEEALKEAIDTIKSKVYFEIKKRSEEYKDISLDSVLRFSGGDLVFFKNSYTKKQVLAYKFEILVESPYTENRVFVEAESGKIICVYNMLCNIINSNGTVNTKYSGQRVIETTQDQLGNYNLKETARGGGIETLNLENKKPEKHTTAINFTDSDNDWININPSDQTALDVHWGMEVAYDYFLAKHARNSFDDKGSKIWNYVHSLTSTRQTDNSFYNPAFDRFFFGDGDGVNYNPLSSLDIVGHEFSHAVVNYTSGLFSYNVKYPEASGLNESFGDIFGTCIEAFGRPEKFNWTIGDEVLIQPRISISPVSVGFSIRNLSSPRKCGHPDTYGTPLFNLVTGSNSINEPNFHAIGGVQNYWFFLLANGGRGKNGKNNKYDINGIGIDKAAKIAYRNLQYLRPTAGYIDARAASERSVIDLYGKCSKEYIQTLNAWYAVGVGDPVIMIDSVFIKKPKCDSLNGKAYIRVKGPDPSDIEYLWTYPNLVQKNTQQISDIGEGQYKVTITDKSNGCQVDTVLNIEEENNFNIKISKTEPSACNINNGTAKVLYNNTQGNPLFSWSTGSHAQEIINLQSGTYSVTVTDPITNCNIDTTITLVSKSNLNVFILGGGIRTFCENAPNKAVNLNALATNCDNCIFSWSNGTVGNSITLTTPGLYIVTARDRNNCETSTSTVVDFVFRNCEDDCKPTSFEKKIGLNKCAEWTIPILVGHDPNDLLGPPGFSEPRWVSVNDRLPYTVRFENDAGLATAPAQKVVIEHIPDADLNLFSFQLGDFGFANQSFTVPPNLTYYSKRLDLRDSLGIYVDLNAGIDINTNKVFWIFQSVDPATGLPPSDPLLGLLPVNDSLSHRGEGYVNFTIKPKTTAATGDTVLAQAAIIFDLNETIPTPEIFNVIDAGAPTSQIVTTLPATTDSTWFEICWTAQDDPGGCGVRDYALYVSQNNAPFYRYQDGITDTCLIFTGNPGGTYSFYTLATDNVGNQEAPKLQGEQEISINEARDLFIYAINQNGFCAGDSLIIQWLASRIDAVDVFFSPDSGATLQPLAANVDTNFIGWRIAAGYTGCSGCALIVVDTAGDFADTIFTAIHPLPAIAPVQDITNAGCHGGSTGAIGVTASGGTAPYNYLWNNGQTTNPANSLVAGAYTLVLTDASGCTASASATVTEPAALALNATGASETCEPGSDGALSLAVSGGTSPYGYAWSDGHTTANVSGLVAGSYTVVVTDAHGCVDSTAVAVGLGTSLDSLSAAGIKVILQGPYVSAVQLMHDSLRVKDLIPLTEPYTGLTGFTHSGGGGGEQTTAAVLAVSGPNAIVDWVFLELRSAANPAQVLATRSALVQRDGDVVGVDGSSPVRFGVPAGPSYYLAVRHRNHLGVQLGAAVDYPVCEVIATDFRTLPVEGFYAFNGLNPAEKTVSGVFVLWAGNGRVDFQLKYNGSNNDRTSVLSVVGLTTPNAVVPGYNLADYNLDGVVKYNGSANDRNVLLGNVGIATPSAVVHDQIAR